MSGSEHQQLLAVAIAQFDGTIKCTMIIDELKHSVVGSFSQSIGEPGTCVASNASDQQHDVVFIMTDDDWSLRIYRRHATHSK